MVLGVVLELLGRDGLAEEELQRGEDILRGARRRPSAARLCHGGCDGQATRAQVRKCGRARECAGVRVFQGLYLGIGRKGRLGL